ncbi:hypothetical protein AgCh_009818 [Apium graveolens]
MEFTQKKKLGLVEEKELVMEFIFSHASMVDAEVLQAVVYDQDDKITEALQQIHRKTLIKNWKREFLRRDMMESNVETKVTRHLKSNDETKGIDLCNDSGVNFATCDDVELKVDHSNFTELVGGSTLIQETGGNYKKNLEDDEIFCKTGHDFSSNSLDIEPVCKEQDFRESRLQNWCHQPATGWEENKDRKKQKDNTNEQETNPSFFKNDKDMAREVYNVGVQLGLTFGKTEEEAIGMITRRLNKIHECVHGPHQEKEKVIFWDILTALSHEYGGEVVCIMGDFKSIGRKEDKDGCIFQEKDAIRFNSFIDDLNFSEVYGNNFNFTWFGQKIKRSKLDRILINEAWVNGLEWSALEKILRSARISILINGSPTSEFSPQREVGQGRTPQYIRGLAPIPEGQEFSGPYTDRDSESSDDDVAWRRRRAGKEPMPDSNQRPRSTRGTNLQDVQERIKAHEAEI